MTENYISKHYIGKKYIHDGYQIILIKSIKDLIYAPFQELTHQNFGNISCGILIFNQGYIQ